jgi:hypothetical protein
MPWSNKGALVPARGDSLATTFLTHRRTWIRLQARLLPLPRPSKARTNQSERLHRRGVSEAGSPFALNTNENGKTAAPRHPNRQHSRALEDLGWLDNKRNQSKAQRGKNEQGDGKH